MLAFSGNNLFTSHISNNVMRNWGSDRKNRQERVLPGRQGRGKQRALFANVSEAEQAFDCHILAPVKQ